MIRETGISITHVLGLIAEGRSYKQILEEYRQLSLGDIMLSARVAADLVEKISLLEKDVQVEGTMRFVVKNGSFKSVDEMKKDYPRAFEKWTEAEQNELVMLYKRGENIKTISKQLERSYGSIKARLERLGLISAGQGSETSPSSGRAAP
jgi:hypothetical protein